MKIGPRYHIAQKLNLIPLNYYSGFLYNRGDGINVVMEK